MFTPRYAITSLLLAQIKTINRLINKLNGKRLPRVVMLELERIAGEVSAHASTSIEGNPLPLTEVKKILKNRPEHIGKSEREVLNYNQALQGLNRTLERDKIKLSPELILKIQKQVTNGLLPRFESGKVRKKAVVVNDPGTGRTVYLPPDVVDVKPLLGDLIDFVNRNGDKVDILILAGIFHKQMVLIHPFMDGNGRAARLAAKVLLAEMGLNAFRLFSFENYYNKNVAKYFQAVGERGNYYDLVEKIDFTPWLEYFTLGIIDELTRVQALMPRVGVSPETALRPYHLKIVEFIREHGFITDHDYAKIVDRAKATRTLDFQKLMDLQLVQRMGRGRATYYTLK